ncbi:hypothetical protein QTH87_21805 [Variovorax sp. J22P168]|uniref:hypothetical protein n=1 Tax=Variovorax jilinensis TaxID=3053513 RepID=UPI0025771BB4|nr:hypothetical protein [Variovorax sp. J22P168]MDM0015095.1 hypothetical protein [Variovorax sp. J22P168]
MTAFLVQIDMAVRRPISERLNDVVDKLRKEGVAMDRCIGPAHIGPYADVLVHPRLGRVRIKAQRL